MSSLCQTLFILLGIISSTAPAHLDSGPSEGEGDKTCNFGLPARATDMVRQRFLIFGDSLTQQSFEEGGWGSRLVSRYQRKADVTLRGYSGYNTRHRSYVKPCVLCPTCSEKAMACLHNLRPMPVCDCTCRRELCFLMCVAGSFSKLRCTRWILQTVDQLFPLGPGGPKYDLATIWFGANDAALPDRCKYDPPCLLLGYCSGPQKLDAC